MALKPAHRALVAALCGVALGSAATLVRHPCLQNVRRDRATILWASDENGSSILQYSTDRDFSRSAAVTATTRPFLPAETGLGAAFFQHRADLTGLAPGTVYYYRVLLDGVNLAPDRVVEQRFRTASDGAFAFLVFGDSGQGTTAQREVADAMVRESPAPALVLHAGDIAYERGAFDQFQRRYFNYYRNLMRRTPFFTTPGNHDYGTNSAAPYLALHAPPTDDVPPEDRGCYYSFDWANVHFISLDTNRPLLDAVNGAGAMLRWVERDLQRTQQAWKVVFFHHAPYPTTVHENDSTSSLVRSHIVPVLDKYSVDLVFSGHEHNYQRTFPLRKGRVEDPGLGTVYLITGGGGAALYPVVPRPFLAYAESAHHYLRAEVQGPRVTVRAMAPDGREIDAFTLERRAPPPGPIVDPPQVSVGSAVNAASFSSRLAPGMLVTLFGQNLAARKGQAARLPLPTRLAGTYVTLNGRRLPLLYVSATQINLQLPFGVLGRATLRVTTPLGSAEVPVVIEDAAPGVFTASPEPAVSHSDGTLVSAAAPAQVDEAISIFLTGLGEVEGRIGAGHAAPFPALPVRSRVQVRIGNRTIAPSFAGLAPGFVGLYQINMQVPRGVSSGQHPLRIVAGDATSNEVTLSVE